MRRVTPAVNRPATHDLHSGLEGAPSDLPLAPRGSRGWERFSRRALVLLALLVTAGFVSCERSSVMAPSSSPPIAPVTAPPGTKVVLVGAGDIARGTGAELTAKLLDRIPGIVITLGDNAYPHGADADYAEAYAPTWGRHRSRTRPCPGNHDYETSGASGYFNYFGDSAGPTGRGYYSFNAGDWHIVSLNSNIDMSAGSAQEQWLRADLAANRKECTLA